MQSGWTPPADPDPNTIHDEALDDAEAGRLELAHQKHLWYHRHATRHDGSLHGVRLTFALADWVLLACRYPPAMRAIVAIRDDAWPAIRAGTIGYEQFAEFAAISRELGQPHATAEAFRALDRDHPRLARHLAGSSLSQLAAAREWALAARYVQPAEYLAAELERLESVPDRAAKHGLAPTFLEFAAGEFASRIATLVALLAASGRLPEARIVAERALGRPVPGLRDMLDRALAGIMPDQPRL